MSMKTRYLLQRSGRDQFDDGQAEQGDTIANPGATPRDEAMWKLHRDLNDLLVQRYGGAWLARFKAKSIKDAWLDLVGRERKSPALGTFRKMAKEFASNDEFLLYWLVSQKRQCLGKLGIPESEIASEMEKFRECGHYFVTFGASKRKFGTMERHKVDRQPQLV